MTPFCEVFHEWLSGMVAFIHEERKKPYWRKFRRLKPLLTPTRKFSRIILRRRKV